MAKNKIERIDQEIAKTREKIAEQQEKLKALKRRKPRRENLETRYLRVEAEIDAFKTGAVHALSQSLPLPAPAWTKKPMPNS